MKLLIIEDDMNVAEITGHLVGRFSKGTCDMVSDSYEALNAFYEKSYDYLIVDQNLPGLKGLQVLKQLDKAIDLDPLLSDQARFVEKMPVIFMSGSEIKVPAGYQLKHFTIQDFVSKSSLSTGLARNLAS